MAAKKMTPEEVANLTDEQVKLLIARENLARYGSVLPPEPSIEIAPKSPSNAPRKTSIRSGSRSKRSETSKDYYAAQRKYHTKHNPRPANLAPVKKAKKT